ncbi:MAG: hypothetical protein QM503_01555 [Bacteroidota bacterium]
MRYTEKQTSFVIIGVLIGILILLFISYNYNWSNVTIDFSGVMVVSIILVVSLILFFQMRTSVDSEKIHISYGIGLINKRILISNIEQVTVVRNSWYYGFGIRMLKNGWLYNIKGLDAVELKMKNSRSIIRIGTGDSTSLKRNIELRLKKM